MHYEQIFVSADSEMLLKNSYYNHNGIFFQNNCWKEEFCILFFHHKIVQQIRVMNSKYDKCTLL